MQILDLEMDVELDRAAMSRIAGGVATTVSASSFSLPTESGVGTGGHGCGMFGGDIQAMIESYIPTMTATPVMPSVPTQPTATAQPDPMVFHAAAPAASSY